MNTKDDKFILGGHEFTSRFILGSGKFSLDLVDVLHLLYSVYRVLYLP